MMGLRKLSPGGHEYLTNSVACGDSDRKLEPGELLSDYYLSRGYPAGQWFGAGAETLGLAGAVTPAQMNALFGEGRHPHADAIEAEKIANGATAAEALSATKLGRRFPQYSALDHLRSKTSQAYKDYNLENGRPIGAPIDADIRADLRRAVQIQAFKDDHKGKAPENDKELTKWLAAQRRALKSAVSGYEMVFAPDKSVSVAWAMAAPAEREKIADLVRQAARDTLSYVEREIAFTRRGVMGEAQVDADGITAALFEHWDSRASDPHLHIHALISSKVRRSDDGQWTSLDGRAVLAATVTASEYFDSRLRDLFRERGARWARRSGADASRTRGVWQLAEVPVALVKGFSRRHRQFEAARAARIVKFRNRHGREPKPKEIFEIDRKAQYDTRPGKPPPKTLAEHVKVWREYAEQFAPAAILDGLAQRVFGSPAQEATPVNVAALARATRAAVSENYSHFNWENLAAEAHRQSAADIVPANKREQLIADIVATVIAEPATLRLEGPALVDEPAALRRRSGESVFAEHHSTRYTTTATLAAEGDLLAWARRGGGHRLRSKTVEKALAGKRLNAGQRRMVTEFARSGRRLQLALAPAGAGKTSAMKVFASAWRRTGGRVYAFGPSARAAQELGAAIGARPHTLHQLVTTQRLGFAHRAFPMGPGDMVIIDEAAMAGTHTLHKVVKYALRKGADVRLIGDDAQLAAVEAGGVIRLIAHDIGAIRFHEVVRFQGEDRKEQAAASLQIREGNARGLEYYVENRRVEGGSLETMRDAAHHAWRADLEAGVPSLLIVPTNEDTIALNLEARELRIRRREITGQDGVELHDGTRAGVGDWVVTRHNQRLLSLFGGKDFVKNGDTWTVVRLHKAGRITVKHRIHGGRITLPAKYAQTYLELAYASTVNRVQGMTSKGNAHLLVPPTMTREQFYPGITRAMLQNFMYVVTHHHVIDQHQETPDPQTPEAVLTGVLNHSGAEISATETLRERLGVEESMGTLVLRYNYTATYRDEDSYLAVLARHAPETAELDSEPALVQTLRNAHDLGWAPDDLVQKALGRSTISGTDDPGAVLQSRVTKYIDGREPPPATAPPRPADVTRWRGIVDAVAPYAAVEDPDWAPVWQRAAGGLAVGFDVDAALTVVAHQLADRAAVDPMPDHRYADHALADELTRREDRGEAHVRAVPWLARPDFAATRDYPGNADYLHHVNTAIADRVDELRAAVVRDQPTWATSLGPRPGNPIAAEEWDEVAGMAAAYRDTFKITVDDPGQPLGEEPKSHGARAQAWRDLTARWDAVAHETEPAPVPQSTKHVAIVDDREIFEEIAEDRFALERLDVLVRQHDVLARDGDEDRFLDVIARYVPDAIGQGAESAAVVALSRAQDAGWQAERLVRNVVDGTGFSWARDPAAVLAKRIRTYTAEYEPPARIASPADADVPRWRDIVTQHLPDAPITAEEWGIVWRHAAGGVMTGLDADAALAQAALALAANGTGAAAGDHRRAGEALVGELTRQHDAGQGHHLALPWLAVADFGHLGNHSGQIERLAVLNAEMGERVRQLLDHVARENPAWATEAGARPEDPLRARRWDETVGLAAAYRETYAITTTDATSPLGRQPTSDGPKAQAWHQITTQWRQLMTTPDREDTESDAMLTLESRRDARDAFNAEFRSDVDALVSSAQAEEAALRSARRNEAESELDDGYDGQSNDLHTGLGY
jgi:conjugative relaxase-like TrwC/TraI family protein